MWQHKETLMLTIHMYKANIASKIFKTIPQKEDIRRGLALLRHRNLDLELHPGQVPAVVPVIDLLAFGFRN